MTLGIVIGIVFTGWLLLAALLCFRIHAPEWKEVVPHPVRTREDDHKTRAPKR